MIDTFFETDEAVELPKWLTDLRDAETVPVASQARQQRLEQMTRDLAACADLVTDCDRYAEFIAGSSIPCVYPIVPRLMNKELVALRARAIAKGRQLKEELATLRGAS